MAEGDAVTLVPAPPGTAPLRVRSVQVHGRPAPRGLASQRTAVNLPGVEAGAIARGQVLTHPGSVPATSMIDAEVTLLGAAPQPLRHRGKLLLHVGTTQVPCTVALVEGESLAPGATALAQISLGERVAALPGQRFILRGFRALEGRGKTLGGGRVLAIVPRRRRRGRAADLAQLRVLAGGDDDARVHAVLEMAGPAGLPAEDLSGRAALAPRAVSAALERLGARGRVLLFDRERRAFVAGEVAEELSGRLLRSVEAFHAAQPLAAGMGREALRGIAPAGRRPSPLPAAL